MSITGEYAAKLVEDAHLAAKVMADTGTFETGQAILLDLARALIASETALKLAEERLAKVKAAFRVNMLRVDPTISHEAIDAILKEIDNG